MKTYPWKSIAILGVSGQFGSFLAKTFLDLGFTVTGVSRSKPKGIDHVKFSWIQADCLDEPTPEVVRALQQNDIVLFSLHIGSTLAGIERIAPHLQAGQLLMDVTSVKVLPCEAMKRCAPEGVTVLGAHPMFAPCLSLVGKNVILSPEKINESDLLAMQELWEALGATVSIMTAEDHDKMVSILQGLTHFVTFAFAKTLKDLQWSLEEHASFETTYFTLFRALTERVLAFDHELYAYIQTLNHQNIAVLEKFIESASELLECVRRGDTLALADEMDVIAKHFPKDEKIIPKTNALIKTLQEY